MVINGPGNSGNNGSICVVVFHGVHNEDGYNEIITVGEINKSHVVITDFQAGRIPVGTARFMTDKSAGR